MINHIFVDMDGVLSDFSKRFREHYKVIPEKDYNDKTKKVYTGQFHDFVNKKHFETLDPMPDLELGLTFLRQFTGICFVNILTSTATEQYLEELSVQKQTWLKKYNIEFYPMFVPGKHIKCYFSKPGRVLIDDTISNITDWTNQGGIGIHHKSWEQTIEEFKKYDNRA